MRWKIYVILSIITVLSNYVTAGTIIVVGTQEEFDAVQQRVIEKINLGERNIDVLFMSGCYEYMEQHFLLKDIDAPQVRLRLKCKGKVVIKPRGKIYHDGDSFQEAFSIYDSWMNEDKDINNWSYVQYADGLVEVYNLPEKICRLKSTSPSKKNSDVKNAFIQIPCWYTSGIYKISRIEDDYIYFTVNDLKISYHNGYNVNDDYNYGGQKIRYKLCNIESKDDSFRIVDGKVILPKGCSYARCGQSDNFLCVSNCSFKSIDIGNLAFYGNSASKSTPFIKFCNTRCRFIIIHDCFFSGMRSTVVSVEETNNIIVENNKFSDCYYNGVYSDNLSKNTVVKDNCFTNMGKRMQNSFCVFCRGEDYSIVGNKMVDFGYGSVAVGVWYGGDKLGVSSGTIEGNEICYTMEYRLDISNNGLMDGGAIYVFTKNDNVVIRNNYIHNYYGIKDNRGIFCDDGAFNLQIYGNVITMINNSYCIDSRRVDNVEEDQCHISGIKHSNINITIHDNVVDGAIRFEGNEMSGNGCFYGSNYQLIREDGIPTENILDDVTNIREDETLDYAGESNGRIILLDKSYSQLKKNSEWKKIKRRVSKNK